ncbi:hypothetical protein KC19_1G329400 [Ceratodon purpureus]|uniref:Uncharacterized protein n=1 Tax=Ceratodon purpureus TaxID=3225 RepID=A0A8T0JBY7_CERPU|nr:hypothetical protein KC19_1G329400 [Ceratodon purpureus]
MVSRMDGVWSEEPNSQTFNKAVRNSENWGPMLERITIFSAE